MQNIDYVIDINSIYPSLNTAGFNITPLITALHSMPGARLSQLTAADLLQPGVFEKGVYLFEEGSIYKMKVTNPPSITLSDYWYIGKCGSLSFPGRLGGHLDTRVEGYTNHLMRYIAWVLSGQNYQSFMALPDNKKQYHYNCAAHVFRDLRLKFISFGSTPASGQFINVLEKCLKNTLHPYLNDPQRGVFKASTLTI